MYHRRMSKSPARTRRNVQKSPYVPIWVMPDTRQRIRELAALRRQEINVTVDEVISRALAAASDAEARIQARLAAREAKGAGDAA